MSLELEGKNRKIVPRWRSPKRTFQFGELSPLKVNNVRFKTDHLDKKINEWVKNKTLSFAADLISSAYVLGEEKKVEDAARFILKYPKGLSKGLELIANKILNPKFSEQVEPLMIIGNDSREQIKYLRKRLKDDPRDALLWLELSRLHTIEGNLENAKQAAEYAVRINKDDRYILRSASRFFTHIGELDRAHYILTKNNLVTFDPWVVAAEIAVSQIIEKSSHNIKIGHKLLDQFEKNPFHISELASALASLELEAGNYKKARKLIRQSLLKPTENSIAQIVWEYRNIEKTTDEDKLDSVPCNFEARSIDYFFSGKWNEALDESLKWCEDQPFSSRPTLMATYIVGTIFSDYQKSISIGLSGLKSNPKDPTLLNNIAFAYASLSNTRKALKYLERVSIKDLKPANMITHLATRGLIYYREGKQDIGRQYYKMAIEGATQMNSLKQKAIASIYQAREEILLGSGNKGKAIMIAEENSKKVTDLDVVELLRKLKTNEQTGIF